MAGVTRGFTHSRPPRNLLDASAFLPKDQASIWGVLTD